MMAIISDIHGNYPALKAVLEDIRNNNGDCEIVSLGDVAGYYCFINECINLLRKEKVINIMGNHDYYLISGKGCPRSFSANVCLKYQTQMISEENLNWLKQSKHVLDYPTISLRHGGWNDPLDEYIYEFSFDMVENRNQKIYISGHTHKQLIIKGLDKTYCNPGSVGQPRDYSELAAYALINDDYSIELRRVEYPIHEVITEMKKNGFEARISECLLTGSRIGETI